MGFGDPTTPRAPAIPWAAASPRAAAIVRALQSPLKVSACGGRPNQPNLIRLRAGGAGHGRLSRNGVLHKGLPSRPWLRCSVRSGRFFKPANSSTPHSATSDLFGCNRSLSLLLRGWPRSVPSQLRKTPAKTLRNRRCDHLGRALADPPPGDSIFLRTAPHW